MRKLKNNTVKCWKFIV